MWSHVRQRINVMNFLKLNLFIFRVFRVGRKKFFYSIKRENSMSLLYWVFSIKFNTSKQFDEIENFKLNFLLKFWHFLIFSRLKSCQYQKKSNTCAFEPALSMIYCLLRFSGSFNVTKIDKYEIFLPLSCEEQKKYWIFVKGSRIFCVSLLTDIEWMKKWIKRLNLIFHALNFFYFDPINVHVEHLKSFRVALTVKLELNVFFKVERVKFKMIVII